MSAEANGEIDSVPSRCSQPEQVSVLRDPHLDAQVPGIAQRLCHGRVDQSEVRKGCPCLRQRKQTNHDDYAPHATAYSSPQERASVDFAGSSRHNRLVLEGKVRETIERCRMMARGETLLVAVSGGVDSVCLLEVLYRLAPTLKIRLALAHLDHGLRGEESRQDARFVVDIAHAKGLPLVCESADVRGYAEEHKIGLEEAGRSLRQAFLERTANQVGAARIAVGHTRDDRAETVLLHLVRGAGTAGLIGIRPVTLPYVRPLIEVSRAEIVAFAQNEGLSWREDSSNDDLRFSRNRIRREVIPALERINPKAAEALARTAELLLESETALEFLLDAPWAAVCASEGAGRVELRRQVLRTFPPIVQGLLVRRGLSRAAGSLVGIEKRHVDALRELATSPATHGAISLPDLSARAQQDELVISTDVPTAETGYEFPLRLGRTELPQLGLLLDLHLENWDGGEAARSREDVQTEVADADRIAFPLRLRSRQPGDRFAPLGMRGTKKLSDFLLDERVPFFCRDSLPLVCDDEKIVWVVGVRLSDQVRLSDSTRRVLVLHAQEMP